MTRSNDPNDLRNILTKKGQMMRQHKSQFEVTVRYNRDWITTDLDTGERDEERASQFETEVPEHVAVDLGIRASAVTVVEDFAPGRSYGVEINGERNPEDDAASDFAQDVSDSVMRYLQSW